MQEAHQNMTEYRAVPEFEATPVRLTCTGARPRGTLAPASRGLEARLQNWGKMLREGRGAQGATEDAMKVNAAWLRLERNPRQLLLMQYAWRAGREVICRRLKIPRMPATVFTLELLAARCALERALDDDTP